MPRKRLTNLIAACIMASAAAAQPTSRPKPTQAHIAEAIAAIQQAADDSDAVFDGPITHGAAGLCENQSEPCPGAGNLVSTAVMFLGVLLNYIVPAKAFLWLTSIALIGTLWTWLMIMLAHFGYRGSVNAGLLPIVAY